MSGDRFSPEYIPRLRGDLTLEKLQGERKYAAAIVDPLFSNRVKLDKTAGSWKIKSQKTSAPRKPKPVVVKVEAE